MSTEADTCRKYVLPKLYAAGRNDDQISEQRTFTDGCIIVAGSAARRGLQKRADYLLRYRPNLLLAVVEAKASQKNPGDGLQQAKEYAQILDLKFAYSTNGHGIVEFEFLSGKESNLDAFPSPEALWQRLQPHLGLKDDEQVQRYIAPSLPVPGKTLRYYQEIAINRMLRAILSGQRRVLVTMATGTGKTDVAFHICWKLWSTRWNRTNTPRRPRILYLSDRSILVDDPKDKQFAPFGDARWKIQGEAIQSRELYFATYQAITKDERRPGLYREYSPEFFDLIIVDECHRGSARDESNWREILAYFEPVYQLGMTATPLRQDNRDTYAYFGSPVYTYSLRQGIDNGFLAPYRVHRIVTDVDATGWRPSTGELDRYGRLIPDGEYRTPDFEREVALRARTQAVAKSIAGFLQASDPYAKTIVFCVNQEHADEMRQAINNECAEFVRKHPDYVVRVVSDEGNLGRGYLSRFQELETLTPAIVTTSRLLTTGVDVPTCKNIAIVRVVNSMTEFKQIIGRGTRVRADYGKLWFSILDYTGSATRLFADPDFDGDPIEPPTESPVDEPIPKPSEPYPEPVDETPAIGEGDEEFAPRKYYIDGGSVTIAAHVVYELDATGKQLRVVKLTDYLADKVRSLWASAAKLRQRWTNAQERTAIIQALEERGILGNFPADKQTAETALLFLQLITRKRPGQPAFTGRGTRSEGGRAAAVVPNGALFGDGVAGRIKEELLKDFNLHTIVRLPNGVFAPYTSIPTNVLFFDRSGPTQDVWYYEHPLPEGRKNYTKTQPLQFEEFAPLIAWWSTREKNDHAWKVPPPRFLPTAATSTAKTRMPGKTSHTCRRSKSPRTFSKKSSASQRSWRIFENS